MWLPHSPFVYSRIIRNAKVQIKVMSKFIVLGKKENVGDVYVMNHRIGNQVFYSVNVHGTGETTMFEDRIEAFKYGKLKQSLKGLVA